jgi:hypothetical protein
MHPNIKCCICVCHNYISIEYLFLSFNKNWYPEVIITNSYFLTDFILRSEVSTVKPSSKFENWANFAYATMNWDIVDDLDCNIKLFADDTSLYVIVDEQNYIQAANMLSTDLSHIHEFWLSLCKIVRSSVILLLPLFITGHKTGLLNLILIKLNQFYLLDEI